MARVLVTGFEPFGGRGQNASWLAALALPADIEGVDVARVQLPCVFDTAATMAIDAVEALDPLLVVALGEHHGATGLEVERGAVNLASTSAADEAGHTPMEHPLEPGSPWAIASTLPVETCALASQAAGVPAALSASAGLFVCNSVFYRLLDHERRRPGQGRPVGFVHVPATPAQALQRDFLAPAVPSMATELAAAGVAAMIKAGLTAVGSNAQE